MSETGLFKTPARIPTFAECHFYHTMEIPGHGLANGDWDLRAGVDDYLGNVSFSNRRVLEIGPASGFLSFEMEKRGAKVVSVEVTDDPGWDFVPYPAALLREVLEPQREIMRRLKNSFWFAHAAHKSKAQVYYGDVYHLPAQLGEFDIALIGRSCCICIVRSRPSRNARTGPEHLSLPTCFIQTWRASRSAASCRAQIISNGIRGGISAPPSSRSSWP